MNPSTSIPSALSSSSLNDLHAPTQLGNIMELIHMVGVYLRQDEDYQSLGRISLACRVYREDLQEMLEEGKSGFARVPGDILKTFPLARLRLVEQTVHAGQLRVLPRGNIEMRCLDPIKDTALTRLSRMSVVLFHNDTQGPIFPINATVPGYTQSLVHLQLVSDYNGPPATLGRRIKNLFPNLRQLSFILRYPEGSSFSKEVQIGGPFWLDAAFVVKGYQAGIRALYYALAQAQYRWPLSCSVEFAFHREDGADDCGWTLECPLIQAEMTRESISLYLEGLGDFLDNVRDRPAFLRVVIGCLHRDVDPYDAALLELQACMPQVSHILARLWARWSLNTEDHDPTGPTVPSPPKPYSFGFAAMITHRTQSLGRPERGSQTVYMMHAEVSGPDPIANWDSYTNRAALISLETGPVIG